MSTYGKKSQSQHGYWSGKSHRNNYHSGRGDAQSNNSYYRGNGGYGPYGGKPQQGLNTAFSKSFQHALNNTVDHLVGEGFAFIVNKMTGTCPSAGVAEASNGGLCRPEPSRAGSALSFAVSKVFGGGTPASIPQVAPVRTEENAMGETSKAATDALTQALEQQSRAMQAMVDITERLTQGSQPEPSHAREVIEVDGPTSGDQADPKEERIKALEAELASLRRGGVAPKAAAALNLSSKVQAKLPFKPSGSKF